MESKILTSPGSWLDNTMFCRVFISKYDRISRTNKGTSHGFRIIVKVKKQ